VTSSGDSVQELLRSAMGTGETVTIVYNAGSRPGQPRRVVALSFTDDEVIIAEPGVHFRKHYKLNKIASVELSNGTRADNLTAVRDPEPSAPSMDTLAQYAEHFGPELRAAGWHVFSSEEQLAVGEYFKNGKPRQSAVVSIAYFEPTGQLYVDVFAPGGDLEVKHLPTTGHERPWRVDSPRQTQGRTFKDLRSAMSHFIDEVRACKATGAPQLPVERARQ
jgi:hypothetical protein